MIWEAVSRILGGATVINAIAALLVYRYLKRASESMEFAAPVISSVEEAEDGSVSVNLLALAALSMDHVSQLASLLKWVRL